MNDGNSPRAAPHPLAGVGLVVLLAFIWGFNWPSMRAAAVSVAIGAAEKVVREHLDGKDLDGLVDNAIAELDERLH